MKGSEIQIKDIMTRIQHVKWGFLEEKGGEIICVSIHMKVGNKSCLIDPYGHVDWFGNKPEK